VDLDVAVFKAHYRSAMSQIKRIGLKYQLMYEVMTFDHKGLNTTALAMGMLLMLRNRPQTNEDEHPMIPHYHVESSNLHEQLEEAEQQAFE
jgi:hypothetical protein